MWLPATNLPLKSSGHQSGPHEPCAGGSIVLRVHWSAIMGYISIMTVLNFSKVPFHHVAKRCARSSTFPGQKCSNCHCFCLPFKWNFHLLMVWTISHHMSNMFEVCLCVWYDLYCLVLLCLLFNLDSTEEFLPEKHCTSSADFLST